MRVVSKEAVGPADDGPPLYLLFLHALQVEGHPLPGPGLAHVFVIRLDISHPRLLVGRVYLISSPARTAPGDAGARDDRPEALYREDPVDGESEDACPRFLFDLGRVLPVSRP